MQFNDFIQKYMRKGNRPVNARLQTALALLERLRENQSLNLSDHLASAGSSGLEGHETWGDKAHDRLSLEALNTTHGRRSSSLQDWGSQLLDILKAAGFETASVAARSELIDEAQAAFGSILRNVLEQEPMRVRLKTRSAEAVIREVLEQADDKGKSGDVAQYLVGAKLMLRLGVEVPVHPANKADRKSRGDRSARLGDFEIEDAIIEVAVGLPDDKHISQIVDALQDTDKEVWLLTRGQRVKTWQEELDDIEGLDLKRVIVGSVEGFVGQNITELGKFSAKGRAAQLEELFKLYNGRWIANVGIPGMLIEIIK
ncbi:MAG: hypothetical protein JWN24_4626 [Phycisphaerales bacterium]|nr:hypothetical protein [Phycisphaerales bacterium]